MLEVMPRLKEETVEMPRQEPEEMVVPVLRAVRPRLVERQVSPEEMAEMPVLEPGETEEPVLM